MNFDASLRKNSISQIVYLAVGSRKLSVWPVLFAVVLLRPALFVIVYAVSSYSYKNKTSCRESGFYLRLNDFVVFCCDSPVA